MEYLHYIINNIYIYIVKSFSLTELLVKLSYVLLYTAHTEITSVFALMMTKHDQPIASEYFFHAKHTRADYTSVDK